MAGRITQVPVLAVGEPSGRKARLTQVVVLCIGEAEAPTAGRNYGFWGKGAIGGGGPNAGIFGD